MEHFIGYHDFERWGPYFREAKLKNSKFLEFFSAKNFRPETLLGNRIWAIEGSKTPRRYNLVSSGIITEVEARRRPGQYLQLGRRDGKNIRFRVDFMPDPVNLTDFGWFRSILKAQRNFSLGFHRVTEPNVAAQLEAIRASTKSGVIDAGLLADINHINSDKSIGQTTRKALIDARLGQGRFRDKLEQRWKNRCAVLGCEVPAILRASHIKPWKSSTNDQRLDPANGLLLAAHIDALFDSGLISFRDDGRMIVSQFLSSKDARNFQLPSSLWSKLTSAEKRYLRYHRDNIFKSK